jgi:hypothetical protein
VQTVEPGASREYLWYAGNLESGADGKISATPVEFGALNLMPSDSLMHVYHGLFGALIVEPAGSTLRADTDYRA